ncbi:MAG: hypothetical protein ABJH08_02615 [Balneola sp.]
MKNISRVLVLIAVTGIMACSGAEQVATNSSVTPKDSVYPVWYSGFEFNSDSTSFTARATSVSSESVTAKKRAEIEARVLLESYIADELEDIRTELERDGSSTVKEAGFILMLRNAHLKIEEAASIVQSESVEKEGTHRGFAKAQITKAEVDDLLRQGFSSNSSYWRAFSGARSYQDFLK